MALLVLKIESFTLWYLLNNGQIYFTRTDSYRKINFAIFVLVGQQLIACRDCGLIEKLWI